MDIGTEFVYDVSERTSDSRSVKRYTEKHILNRIDGDVLIFERYINDVRTEDIEGLGSYANGTIRMDHMRQCGTVGIETAFGKMDLDHYRTDLCGGGSEVFMKDIVYRYIQKQMWSGGVIFERTYDLRSTSLRPL